MKSTTETVTSGEIGGAVVGTADREREFLEPMTDGGSSGSLRK